MTTEIRQNKVNPSGLAGTLNSLPSRVLNGFHSLKVRNYRLFIFGQIVSLTGTWMQTTAQAWLVLTITKSAFVLGTITTLQFLPVMLLALYGGVLADRLPKRRTLIVTQTLLLIQATIFGVLVGTGTIQLWHIYILAMLQGIVNAIDTPVRQSFVVEMVGRDELVNAVALNSMTFNLARILGPSIAGIIIAIPNIGIGLALDLNAISFVAVIIALFMMNEKMLFSVPPTSEGSTWKRLKDGLSYTLHTPDVLAIMIVLAAIGTFGYNFTIVLPLIADFVLHTNPQQFGALSAFFGIGSLISALSTIYVKRITMRRLMLGAGAFSIVLGAVAITPIFALSALLLIALGASGIIFMTSCSSLLQLMVPDTLRGRVMSLQVLLIMGSTPIGAFFIGAISDHLGVSAAVFTCALLCILGVIGAAFYQRAHQQPQAN